MGKDQVTVELDVVKVDRSLTCGRTRAVRAQGRHRICEEHRQTIQGQGGKRLGSATAEGLAR
jgi:hypothetical protein